MNEWPVKVILFSDQLKLALFFLLKSVDDMNKIFSFQ
jgi:hypothetical protein